MTNALEMRKSNLVLPTTYYELDREEMSYVDGGIYMSQQTVDQIVFSICATTTVYGVTALTLAIKSAGSLIIAALSAIPVVGPVLTILGKIWLAAQALNIAEALTVAMVYRKGIDISLGWHWFVPVIDFVACR